MMLEKLKNELKCCNDCNLKHKRLILPHGNIKNRIMFVGEAPSIHGVSENVKIFSRKSKYVYDSLLNSLGYDIDDVYTTNMSKCCDRGKTIGDFEKCKKYLMKEIEIIQPSIIVVLSSKVSKFLYYDKRICSVFKHDLNTWVILYYHPMYCVRGGISLDEYCRKFITLYLKVRKNIEILQKTLFDMY